jgi:DNA modification methylase
MTDLIRADARRIPLADGSVHCVVTSPPYWRLRDYGTAGQLGLEPTPDEYIANMVQVFREVRRVLRDDGCLWLNMGDRYGAGTRSTREVSTKTKHGYWNNPAINLRPQAGLKPKNLVGVPWMLAFALRADGWYLRSDIIWSKPNPMPESVTDRPTKTHEYIFLLTKRSRYFYDAGAVREAFADSRQGRDGSTQKSQRNRGGRTDGYTKPNNIDPSANGGRNLRSVWTITTQPYPGAHFATFPEALPERCIKAGTSERGCCPECGKPWERVVDKSRVPTRPGANGKAPGARIHELSPYHDHHGMICGNRDPFRHTTATVTTGWRQGCTCPPADPVPCTVLDPFAGSGTTGAVCAKLGRRFVGLELNPKYLQLAVRRIGKAARPSTYRADVVEDDAPLFAVTAAGG